MIYNIHENFSRILYYRFIVTPLFTRTLNPFSVVFASPLKRIQEELLKKTFTAKCILIPSSFTASILTKMNVKKLIRFHSWKAFILFSLRPVIMSEELKLSVIHLPISYWENLCTHMCTLGTYGNKKTHKISEKKFSLCKGQPLWITQPYMKAFLEEKTDLPNYCFISLCSSCTHKCTKAKKSILDSLWHPTSKLFTYKIN